MISSPENQDAILPNGRTKILIFRQTPYLADKEYSTKYGKLP